MKIYLFSLINLFLFFSIFCQEKLSLDHYVYENWKEIRVPIISSDGRFVCYEVNPQLGDGNLVIHNLKEDTRDTIPRGNNATFSYDSRFIVGMIAVPRDSIREAKRDKKKPEELFHDSLFVFYLNDKRIEKFSDVRSYKLNKEGNNIVAIHLDYLPEKYDYEEEENGRDRDYEELDKKFSEIARKFKLADLIVFDPSTGSSQNYENISSYSLSKNGELLSFHQLARDTIVFSVVYALENPGKNLNICYEGEGMIHRLSTDDAGKQIAFLFSQDSLKNTGMELNYWTSGMGESQILIDSLGTALDNDMVINGNGNIYFSGNSSRLFFGTSLPEEEESKDTLLNEEKASLDIWNWQDQILQPMQLKQLRNEKNKTYLACYDFDLKKPVQLANKIVENIQTLHEGNGDIMIGFSMDHYGKYLSWEGLRYRDVYSVDPYNGDKKLLVRKLSASIHLSPFGNYLLYYSREDSSWFSRNIKTGQTINLTHKLAVNFYDEWNDVPMIPGSYGIAGFTKDDEWVLIYDRYDIWKMDPAGKKPPINMTNDLGRMKRIQFRYIRLDPDEYYIDTKKPIYLNAFHEESMEDGFYIISEGEVKELIASDHSYSGLQKASDGEKFIFRKGDFRFYNDVYVAGDNLKYPERISRANPQSDRYLWGNVELVEWLSFNGDSLKGLLYTPENLNRERKYPMLIYFYERYSSRIHNHRIPSPSRSIINPAWCTSNSYIVFIPDIIYRDGYPGQSAYDAVVSGTQSMLERYPFIDSKKMGLQGQSWGGYQVAWLVTQTNLFAAAMAGAPVSNMTSAYGGIRWGTGMSRMFQYEKTQSRIGGTLWDKEALYIENSPLFHVPKIETPLLIMHNDNDGAVPWYQGIELFVAMRRLGKPAWMLTYNDEEHNLTKWPNRIDLDIRMMQFFDHYLKGTEMPAWMSEGVPAIDKNEITGKKLLEK